MSRTGYNEVNPFSSIIPKNKMVISKTLFVRSNQNRLLPEAKLDEIIR